MPKASARALDSWRRPRRRFSNSTGRRAIGVVVAVLAVQAAIAFPGNKPEPHHVPVASVGPSKLESALAAKAGSAISVRSYRSEQENSGMSGHPIHPDLLYAA